MIQEQDEQVLHALAENQLSPMIQAHIKHSDDAPDTHAACLDLVNDMHTTAENRLVVITENNIPRRQFLRDISDRASAKLTNNYHTIAQAQNHVLDHKSIHQSAIEPLHLIGEANHMTHFMLHGIGLYASHHKSWIGFPLEIMGIGLGIIGVVLEQGIHYLKATKIDNHPAKLINSLTQIQMETLFKAICLDLVVAWADNIPTPEPHILATEKDSWTERLYNHFHVAMNLVSQSKRQISMKDAVDRALITTKSIGGSQAMSHEVRKLVAEYPHVIEVHKILSGMVGSNSHYWSVNDATVNRLNQSPTISGRFLLDVLDDLLSPYKDAATRNKFVSVVFCFYLISSIDDLRKHYARINHAVAYIAQHLVIPPQEQERIPNYTLQKAIADTLLYNYIDKFVRTDIGAWFKPIDVLRSKNDQVFKSTRVFYNNGDTHFIIQSTENFFEQLSIQDLEHVIVVKDQEIEALNASLATTTQTLAAANHASEALRLENSTLRTSNTTLQSRNAGLAGQITEKDTQLSQKDSQLSQKDSELKQKDEQLEKQAAEIKKMRDALKSYTQDNRPAAALAMNGSR